MSITCIEKIATEQQAQEFSKFIKDNNKLKSIHDIQIFIKPIQELIGVVNMDKREVDVSSFHEKLECENIGFNFLLLKLENNKSIIFKEFCYPDKVDNFISYHVDFSGEAEQKEREKFYKIDTILQNVFHAQEKLKEQQNILLCHID